MDPFTNFPSRGTQEESTESEEREKWSVEFVVCKENFIPLLGLQASQQTELIYVCEDKFDRDFAVNVDYKYLEVFCET